MKKLPLIIAMATPLIIGSWVYYNHNNKSALPVSKQDKIAAETGGKSPGPMPTEPVQFNNIAGEFVKMALAFGAHDENYVDAYTGVKSLQTYVEKHPQTLAQIKAKAENLQTRLSKVTPPEGEAARLKFLKGDITALQTRLAMLEGKRFSFDEETLRLYGSVAPRHDMAFFAAARAELAAAQAGGKLDLIVPPQKVKAVMSAAIAECRKRTLAHYDLPAGESFELEFVTGKPWSAYNWYKGDYKSVIQVNMDQPMGIGKALDLGCHEGYPGHHTYNVMAERDRIKAKGWIENTVVPLYSPSGPLMEGSGNYGIKLAFPGDEKMAFERDVLYPLAGLNPKHAQQSQRVEKALAGLSHVSIHAAREYLDGRMSRDEAVAFLVKYYDDTPKRAQQRVDFYDTYRGYVVNYALGQDVIGDYVGRRVAQGDDPWTAFRYVLDSPITLEDLTEK
ncbi:MAG: hypothetical protein V3U82_04385 [Robiginitomaculum sp.]